MKKLIPILLILLIVASTPMTTGIPSTSTPSDVVPLEAQTEMEAPMTVAWDDNNLNSLDSSGGNEGWSPCYLNRNNQFMWDQYWTASYRHLDTLVSTPYGTGVRMQGDTNSVASTAPKGFYQYKKISVDVQGEYILHLDFNLKEDSSTTLSSVDNWRILILSAKHSTWTTPLWSYYESNCDEHGVFRSQIFDVTLEDSEVYILIGHGDGWSSDWKQGHTMYFNEISAEATGFVTVVWQDSNLNSLDSSGGDQGWSPCYINRNSQFLWDQRWTGSYRHLDTLVSTPYGTGVRMQGDRYSVASTAPGQFYQYKKISVNTVNDYILHLDFNLKEDSSTTASSVDNWRILILSAKHSTWTTPLWSYYESNCNEHGVFRSQIFDVPLEDSEVYILVGHGDGWSADWKQGHTMYFNEISVDITATEEVIPISEDCFVRSLTPDINYNWNYLRAGTIIYGGDAWTYLKFDLLGTRDLISAKLRIFCRDDDAPFTTNIRLSAIDNSDWSEDSLTWNTRPDGIIETIAESAAVEGTWHEWDVSSYITSHENSTVTFILSETDGSLFDAEYWSKEYSTDYCPQLVIVGEYTIEHFEDVLHDAYLVPLFYLYDPIGNESYQTFTQSCTVDYSFSFGIETKLCQVVAIETEIDVTTSTSFTYTSTYSSSQESDPDHVGFGGDTVVGEVYDQTYRFWGFHRFGKNWNSTTVIDILLESTTLLYEDAQVSRAEIPNCPFKVPEIPDMRQVTSPYSKSHYTTNPYTATVIRSSSSSSEISFAAGVDSTLTFGAGVPDFEFKLMFKLTWTDSSTEGMTTKYVLYESGNHIAITACSEAAMTIDDDMIETNSYLFWFNY